jgi:hypothetical protein
MKTKFSFFHKFFKKSDIRNFEFYKSVIRDSKTTGPEAISMLYSTFFCFNHPGFLTFHNQIINRDHEKANRFSLVHFINIPRRGMLRTESA